MRLEKVESRVGGKLLRCHALPTTPLDSEKVEPRARGCWQSTRRQAVRSPSNLCPATWCSAGCSDSGGSAVKACGAGDETKTGWLIRRPTDEGVMSSASRTVTVNEEFPTRMPIL